MWIPLLLLSFSLSVAPAAGQNRFRAVSGGFGTAIHAVLWVGYEKKIFQKYGLDMEYLAIENGTVSMQTLLANETQAAFTTGALAVTANLQGGDSTIIAGGINFIPNKLVTRPDIKRPEDLKGKRIAISRFGSASDYATQLALEKLNVNPKDISIIQAGGNSTRFSAIVGGSIHATLLSEPLTTMALRDHKMNSLIDLAESGVPFPQNAFLVRRSYLEANRSRVVNFMKGVIEGYYTLKNDKPLAIQMIKKYIRVNDEEAGIGYDYYLAKHAEGILELPDRRGLQFVIDDIAKTNPKAAGQTPESLRLLEPSVLDEIKKSGFVEKVK